MHTVDLMIIAAYLVLMIAVGWWVAKKAAQGFRVLFPGRQEPAVVGHRRGARLERHRHQAARCGS